MAAHYSVIRSGVILTGVSEDLYSNRSSTGGSVLCILRRSDEHNPAADQSAVKT